MNESHLICINCHCFNRDSNIPKSDGKNVFCALLEQKDTTAGRRLCSASSWLMNNILFIDCLLDQRHISYYRVLLRILLEFSITDISSVLFDWSSNLQTQ